MWCWGEFHSPVLVESYVPVEVGAFAYVGELEFGPNFACGIWDGGEMRCAGANASGQRGDGTVAGRYESDFSVVDASGPWVQVDVGSSHACARHDNGTVWCWGDNARGQLGVGGELPEARSPVQVLGIEDAVDLGVGFRHTCVLSADESVFCWGRNGQGQLGDGSMDHSNTPARVVLGD